MICPNPLKTTARKSGDPGRDGKPALCEVLANRDNIHILENFIYGDTPEMPSILQLLRTIKENKDSCLGNQNQSHSANELNIRILPLKTLLVYLALEEIIRPKLDLF